MTAFTTIVVLSMTTNVVHGRRIAIPDVSRRVALAECICVGKVLRIEPKLMKFPRYANGRKVDYKIAIVKVEKSYLVPNNVTHLRVAVPSAEGSLLGGYGFGEISAGNTVCLFLESRFGSSLYSPRQFYDVVGMKHPNYKKEAADTEKLAKLMQQPMKSLQSKDATERLITAMLLITKYRYFYGGKPKAIPIDAKESELILQVLATADWSKPTPGWPRLHPRNCFNLLGLTQKDGWTQPNTLKKQNAAAKAWLTANAKKYRIQKLVSRSN